jgi:DNA-binding transcriptional MerR regulator
MRPSDAQDPGRTAAGGPGARASITIGQLAAYAGVTIKAVRHYHRIGLLPEPPRDSSGYRRYDASAVVTLIRIHALADAGVPLARVQQLLDAEPEEFAAEVRSIDTQLRAEIRRLQRHRTRVAALASGDSLALPRSVVDYLDRLRRLGVDERVLQLERDAWIMVAAQVPDEIDAVIARKQAELDDPDMVRLYLLLSQAVGWTADEPRIVELADTLETLMNRSIAAGRSENPDDVDDTLIDLVDATSLAASPVAGRLLEILQRRGWRGWTRVQRLHDLPDETWRRRP